MINMQTKINYRDRCYSSYVDSIFSISHKLSPGEFNYLASIYHQRFASFLPKDKKAAIVDIACGSGHFLYFLQKEGYVNAQGIDLSKQQLEVAQSMGIKNVQVANFFSFLKDKTHVYELIVAFDVLEHLYKDELLQALDLCFQALKPGGKIIVAVPNAGSLLGAHLAYIDLTHETSFTFESLWQALAVCGFSDIFIKGEEPVVHDFRSFVRSFLWRVTKKVLSYYVTIERGTGRGYWFKHLIFEPRMFAVAKKL